ncbi:hypothetical protein ECDEC4C_1931 [Escherichia coli DEC4C]|nr:hypothetical protein ECDEC4C_1931 [Escherichia coli DEC4C]
MVCNNGIEISANEVLFVKVLCISLSDKYLYFFIKPSRFKTLSSLIKKSRFKDENLLYINSLFALFSIIPM